MISSFTFFSSQRYLTLFRTSFLQLDARLTDRFLISHSKTKIILTVSHASYSARLSRHNSQSCGIVTLASATTTLPFLVFAINWLRGTSLCYVYTNHSSVNKYSLHWLAHPVHRLDNHKSQLESRPKTSAGIPHHRSFSDIHAHAVLGNLSNFLY